MNKAVIGLGFGDEGKGLVTDYLCSQDPNSLVVRFNGGHQAGHTVVTEDMKHIFANFGSGTLRGCPTYWTKYCTIDPIGILNELDVLLEKGIIPILYIDAECPVTTPYDIENNRYSESNLQHGSCGVGFGSTIEREENYYSLTFYDLFYPEILHARLSKIKEYYNNCTTGFLNFLRCCNTLITTSNIKLKYRRPEGFDTYIYEGAQGLMLDQKYGIFPNVTRSNCGTINLPDEDFEFYLVTRAYQTRHGNGFMTNEDINFDIIEDPNESNTTHEYQGIFRRSMLDVSLLEYALNKDNILRESGHLNLVMTCLDHLKEFSYVYRDEIFKKHCRSAFIESIADILNIRNVYYSESSNSKGIYCFRKE